MKSILIAILLIIPGFSLGSEDKAQPLSVVNSRMDAYNKHDINAFLATYSDDIQVYTYPNKPLGSPGKEHLKNIFEPMFKEKSVKVEIHQQITQGKYVINHETVFYQGSPQKYVSIYEVENGLIKSVQFVRE